MQFLHDILLLFFAENGELLLSLAPCSSFPTFLPLDSKEKISVINKVYTHINPAL